MGLAFIAGRRGTEGGSHSGPELSAPWYIRIAKRGSGTELKLTQLQNLGVWCWCLWADAMATAVFTPRATPVSITAQLERAAP